MNMALKDVDIYPNESLSQRNYCNTEEDDADLYTLAKTYFDLKELDRCEDINLILFQSFVHLSNFECCIITLFTGVHFTQRKVRPQGLDFYICTLDICLVKEKSFMI